MPHEENFVGAINIIAHISIHLGAKHETMESQIIITQIFGIFINQCLHQIGVLQLYLH